MGNQLSTGMNFDTAANVPAYLQAYRSETGKNLVVGGPGRNRIGLKGSRFRLVVNGQEEGVIDENYLDVVIVGAAPGVSRLYYADAYDANEKVAPTCYSKDGITPENDAKVKQSEKCATCPQNEKGSRITDAGAKTRACSFFKRLAVVLPSEPTRVFQLDCKSMSIFGEGKPAQNKFTLGEYGKKLSTRGVDPAHVVTRLSFDTDASVPKLLFTPTRYLEQDEAPVIAEVSEGADVKAILEITMATTDLSHETDAPAPAPAAAKPAAAPAVTKSKPAVTRVTPVVKQAPAPAAEPDTADEGDLAALIARLEAEDV
jgi:hypothetical protein